MKWCARRDLNPQPSDPKSDALSIELRAQAATSNTSTEALSRRKLLYKPHPDMTGDRGTDRVRSYQRKYRLNQLIDRSIIGSDTMVGRRLIFRRPFP